MDTGSVRYKEYRLEKSKEFKDDSDGCIDTWVEVMRLHLEQDNLTDERQASTAILSNLEGTTLKCVVANVRRRSDPEESKNRRNFSIALKFIDGVKIDDLRTMLATYYTISKDNLPTPEEMRQKSREYMKPKKNPYSENRNMRGKLTTEVVVIQV